MKAVSGRELAKILKKKGWELKRIHGSHYIYLKRERKERISIPIHGKTVLKIGIQKYIMKIAEISEEDL